MATNKLFDNSSFQVFQEKDGDVFLMFNEEYAFPISDLVALNRFLTDVEFLSRTGSSLLKRVDHVQEIVAPTRSVR